MRAYVCDIQGCPVKQFSQKLHFNVNPNNTLQVAVHFYVELNLHPIEG